MNTPCGTQCFGAVRRYVCRTFTGGTMFQPNAVLRSAHAVGRNDQQEQVVFPFGLEPKSADYKSAALTV